MRDFYVLELIGEYAEIQTITYKHRNCATCGVRPQARVGPMGIRLKRKDELLDFVRTTDGDCIRQRVVDALTSAHLSGWRPGMIHVEATGRLAGVSTDYSELVVIGHTKDYAHHAGLVPEFECPECGFRRYAKARTAIVMPIECWDGSDVFAIEELPGLRITTQAFRATVEALSFSGVRFTHIDDWVDYPP